MKNLNKNRVFRFNRRIRKQTDYKKRLELLKSKLTRVVIRRSNKNVLIQFVDYSDSGDKILTSAKSHDLKSFKFTLNTGNSSSAYLTGYLAGKRLLKTKFAKTECIVDLGLQRIQFGSRLFAAVKGVVDSGVKVRTSEDIFPVQERIDGTHLKAKDAKKVIEATKKAIEGMK